MQGRPALGVAVEGAQYRAARQIGVVVARGAHHLGEPRRRGDLVVVDHQKILDVLISRARSGER